MIKFLAIGFIVLVVLLILWERWRAKGKISANEMQYALLTAFVAEAEGMDILDYAARFGFRFQYGLSPSEVRAIVGKLATNSGSLTHLEIAVNLMRKIALDRDPRRAVIEGMLRSAERSAEELWWNSSLSTRSALGLLRPAQGVYSPDHLWNGTV